MALPLLRTPELLSERSTFSDNGSDAAVSEASTRLGDDLEQPDLLRVSTVKLEASDDALASIRHPALNMSASFGSLGVSGRLALDGSLKREKGLRRRRPAAMTDCFSSSGALASLLDDDDGPPHRSPHRCESAPVGLRRRPPTALTLGDSFKSSCSLFSPTSMGQPDTPLPDRDSFRHVIGGVSVIFFDFDGTLTASPGDRAQRRQKQVELRERAPLLAPRLQILREAGITLGIISKSSEGTITSALEAAGLANLFDGPIVANAVGFEGKAGYIDDLVRRGVGVLRKVVLPTRGWPHRILLVDDDVLELERARARGIQTYAAPAFGGLQVENFDEILLGLRLRGRQGSAGRGSLLSWKGGSLPALTCRDLHNRPRSPCSISPFKPPSKRRNMILFFGECFEG